MKSLSNPNDRAAVLARLRRVRPDTPRQWGRMTAPQMICHLTDARWGYRHMDHHLRQFGL